jgi:hypothetical protein
MKVVVQNIKTRAFLDADCHWQPEVAKALEFETTGEAVCFCTDLCLADAQVVLNFDGDTRVFLPVGVKPWRKLVDLYEGKKP